MELQLFRVDYTVMGVANKNCLRLLPPTDSKEQQKVAIADSEGILQLFSVRKDDIHLHFKTLPGPPITSLKISGASGTVNDKIFIAVGNEVKGYTKKGKLFLVFDSGMTENITTMFVLGNELFLCGKHIYYHYRDCKEVGSYLCGDTIVDVTACYMLKNRRLMSLIACESRMIRVLEHARVTASIEVESSPTVLHVFDDEELRIVLFGTIDGRVGILDIETLQGFQRWLVSNSKNCSAVVCMDTYDMTGNGRKDLVLGRQDGNIEVYSVNIRDEMDTTALLFVENCNESIMSLQCGIVAARGYNEILAVTYSGRIVGFTTQVTEANFDGLTGSYVFSTDTSAKISKLKLDIEELQTKLGKEREKYQDATLTNMMELSAISLIPINFSFILEKKNASYLLTLEAPTAVDHILIECNTKVDLLDVEKNTAVVSYSGANNLKNPHQLLATYRCQMNTSRIELKIQTTEGYNGILQGYVSPLIQPRCSRLLQFDIKALSLHYRISEDADLNRPYSNVTFRGSFSLAEIHSWIGQCLPEVPEKPQMSESSTLFFQSCILGTVLICSYKKGEAEFKSDNLSTLSVLKEVLSVEATNKKTKIDIYLDINDECIDHILKLVEPRLIEYNQLLREKDLCKAITELEIADEDNIKYLCDKYRTVLKKKNVLTDYFRGSPCYLERLYDSIIDLFLSYNKLRGVQFNRQKMDDLKKHLDNYSFEKVLAVFKPKAMPS